MKTQDGGSFSHPIRCGGGETRVGIITEAGTRWAGTEAVKQRQERSGDVNFHWETLRFRTQCSCWRTLAHSPTQANIPIQWGALLWFLQLSPKQNWESKKAPIADEVTVDTLIFYPLQDLRTCMYQSLILISDFTHWSKEECSCVATCVITLDWPNVL